MEYIRELARGPKTPKTTRATRPASSTGRKCGRDIARARTACDSGAMVSDATTKALRSRLRSRGEWREASE